MAAQESTPPTTQNADPEVCCHHWAIQPATGPLSQGVCRICGEVREFKNYVEAATWGDSRLSNRSNSEESKGTVKSVADKEEVKDEDEE